MHRPTLSKKPVLIERLLLLPVTMAMLALGSSLVLFF